MTIARQRATNARSAPIWRSPATPRAAMLTTNPFDDDKLREECGVFGVSGAADSAAALVALGLHALQHRGQEARSEEHTSELQSLMRTSYAVFCLKKKKTHH